MGNYGLSYILQRQEHNKNKYNKRNKDYSRIKPHGFVISEVNPDARVYFNVGAMGKKKIREKVLNHSLNKWI